MSGNLMIWLIVGMSLVTAIPRLLPFIINVEQYLPDYALTGLQFVPVAALTALVVPGIFYAGSTPLIGLVGGSVAIVLSLFPKNNMIVTVTVSFIACLFANTLIN